MHVTTGFGQTSAPHACPGGGKRLGRPGLIFAASHLYVAPARPRIGVAVRIHVVHDHWTLLRRANCQGRKSRFLGAPTPLCLLLAAALLSSLDLIYIILASLMDGSSTTFLVISPLVPFRAENLEPLG